MFSLHRGFNQGPSDPEAEDIPICHFMVVNYLNSLKLLIRFTCCFEDGPCEVEASEEDASKRKHTNSNREKLEL